MQEYIIRPQKFLKIDYKELWSYRELFYTLALRDIKVRYKQTFIGIFWALVQPFLMMVVFSIFFGKMAGIETGGIPYPIFVFSGLLFWNYFSSSLNGAAESMVANQSIVQKVYFPRLIMPISATIVRLVDFVFAVLIFIGLMIYYQFIPTITGIMLIIPSILITFLASAGLGLVLASINVKYRDVRHAVPFFIQLLLFVTPVIYPITILGKYQWLMYFNPMSGVIEAMRASLLGVGSINWQLLGISAAIAGLLFVVGLIYFNKTEKFFADTI